MQGKRNPFIYVRRSSLSLHCFQNDSENTENAGKYLSKIHKEKETLFYICKGKLVKPALLPKLFDKVPKFPPF